MNLKKWDKERSDNEGQITKQLVIIGNRSLSLQAILRTHCRAYFQTYLTLGKRGFDTVHPPTVDCQREPYLSHWVQAKLPKLEDSEPWPPEKALSQFKVCTRNLTPKRQSAGLVFHLHFVSKEIVKLQLIRQTVCEGICILRWDFKIISSSPHPKISLIAQNCRTTIHWPSQVSQCEVT